MKFRITTYLLDLFDFLAGVLNGIEKKLRISRIEERSNEVNRK